MFPQDHDATTAHLLDDDAIVVREGPARPARRPAQDHRDGDHPARARARRRPAGADQGASSAALSDAKVARLKEILSEHPGDSPVFVHLESPRRPPCSGSATSSSSTPATASSPSSASSSAPTASPDRRDGGRSTGACVRSCCRDEDRGARGRPGRRGRGWRQPPRGGRARRRARVRASRAAPRPWSPSCGERWGDRVATLSGRRQRRRAAAQDLVVIATVWDAAVPTAAEQPTRSTASPSSHGQRPREGRPRVPPRPPERARSSAAVQAAAPGARVVAALPARPRRGVRATSTTDLDSDVSSRGDDDDARGVVARPVDAIPGPACLRRRLARQRGRASRRSPPRCSP